MENVQASYLNNKTVIHQQIQQYRMLGEAQKKSVAMCPIHGNLVHLDEDGVYCKELLSNIFCTRFQ